MLHTSWPLPLVSPSTPSSLAGWASPRVAVAIGPTDRISNLPVVVDYDHHQLHAGEVFRWSTYVASLGVNAAKDLRLVVPNITIPNGNSAVGLCPHLLFEVVASSDVLAYLHEGTTWSANGASRTPVAMERNGAYTPKLQVFEDPTVSALGTLLWQGLLVAGRPVAGNVEGPAAEFVLKNNTSYSFRVVSEAPLNKVLIRLMWHEDLGA